MSILFNIGALVTAIGTLSTARVGILSGNLTSRLDRRRDRKERRRRARAEVRRHTQEVLDVVVTIHAEILSGLAAGGEQVFEAVYRDIAMLPPEVIHSVAQYHRLARQTVEMLRHLRDPAFLGPSPRERTKFLRTFVQVSALQKAWGKLAIADLEKYAAGGSVDVVRSRRRADALLDRARRKLVAIVARLDKSGPASRHRPAIHKVNRKSA